ncbi:MAG: hypothetical protein EXS05_01860 [Planctomycetaceae bacterium]|nr:hypothetical protein [Planctomycetaceae bacterium]
MESPIRIRKMAAVIALIGAVCATPAATRLASLAAEPVCGNGGPGCHCRGCGCEVWDGDQCVVVPDTKTTKKWVYSTKLVPFCVKGCPNLFKCRHDACETCPECESCVRYKRVLIKREVVTKTEGFKCIPLCEACRNAKKKAKEHEKSKPSPMAETKSGSFEPAPVPGTSKPAPSAARDARIPSISPVR